MTCLHLLILLGEEVGKYEMEPLNDFQKLMRGACTTLYNHTAINHKQFVKDVIALVPDGGITRTYLQVWVKAGHSTWLGHGSTVKSLPGQLILGTGICSIINITDVRRYERVQGYKHFLMILCSWVIEGNKTSKWVTLFLS